MSRAENCAEASVETGESLVGTAAASTGAWIIIEISEAWAAKPLESPVLKGPRRQAIENWLAAIPGSRLQFVRRPGRGEVESRCLFLGSSVPGSSWLVGLSAANLDELCGFDVPAMFLERGGRDAFAVDRLVLVCTHGKRDRCCALHGTRVFAEASRLQPEVVWQTSHLGGHRFAATALALPSGICYGRLQVGDVAKWLQADGSDEIFDIERVRGRTAYDAVAQAAEVAALRHLELRRSDSLRFVARDEISANRWLVTFGHGDSSVAVAVHRDPVGRSSIGSCGDQERRDIFNYVGSVANA